MAAAALTVALLPAVAAQAATTPAAGVFFKVAQSNKCLNVANGSTANSAAIVQYTCGTATATNDKFKLVPEGNDAYWIQGVGSGKCLNVSGGSVANNAAVIQYTCSTSPNELWYVDEVPDKPTYRFVSYNSGKCLNIPGGSTANSVALVQYTCSGGTTSLNEQFYLPPTTSGTATHRAFTADQPVTVMQGSAATTGGVAPFYYSWIDAQNQLNMLTDFNPDPNTTTDQDYDWVYVPGYGYTGRTYEGPLQNGRVQVVSHDAAAGDAVLLDESTKGTADWGYLYDIGGGTAAQPTVGPLSTNGSLATYAVVGGALWYAPQTVNDAQAPYGAWRSLGGTTLTGTPVIVKTATGVRVFALTTAGHVQTATLTGSTLSDWTDLGGTGLNGTLSVVAGPSGALSIFARSTGGTIVTQKQSSTGAFPGTWTTVGDFAAAGSPAAVLNTYPGQIAVAIRGTDNLIYMAYETGPDTGAYSDWIQVSEPDTDPATIAASDPTAFSYDVPSGSSFGLVFQSTDGNPAPMIITFDSLETAAGAAKAGALAKRATPHHKIERLKGAAKKKAGLTSPR
jgi:hypothetical protein